MDVHPPGAQEAHAALARSVDTLGTRPAFPDRRRRLLEPLLRVVRAVPLERTIQGALHSLRQRAREGGHYCLNFGRTFDFK
jgi:hypothetical protein